MAGQIARLLGATRVIGSTSRSSKARWMQEELGYDAVVTRDGGPMNEQLAKAAPEGIDVIVDMVGVNSSRRRLSWQGMVPVAFCSVRSPLS